MQRHFVWKLNNLECKCCSKCCASAECKTDSHTKFKADSAKYTKWKQDRALSQASSAETKAQALPGAAGQGAGSVPDSPEHGLRKEKIDESEDAFWTAVYKGAEAMDAFVHSNMNAIFLEKQIKCLEQYAQKNKPMDVSQHEKKGDNIELDDISELPVLSFMVKKFMQKLAEMNNRLEKVETFSPTQPVQGEAVKFSDPAVARLIARIEVLESKNPRPPITVRPPALPHEEKKAKDQEKRIGEMEKKVAELSKRKTVCDSAFRQKYKKVIEKYFHIEEFGEQEVVVKSRESGHVLARKIQGVVYGDGGPYIECNEEDIEKRSFEKKKEKDFMIYGTRQTRR